jgi:hypothetical protein
MAPITSAPPAQGLYDPANEHDACGVGFVAHIKGKRSHGIVEQGLLILKNLDHRGAVGADALMGDGAGILIQIPDELYRDWARGAGYDLPLAGQYAVAMCFLPRDEEARKRALTVIRSMWYGKADYFTARNTEGISLLNPAAPEKEGQNRDASTDSRGKHYSREMTELVRGPGEGYVTYYTLNPDTKIDSEKTSYIKLYRPWGIAIAAGVFTDDLVAEMHAAMLQAAAITSALVLLLGGVAIWQAQVIVGALKRLRESMALLASGRHDVQVSDLDRTDEMGEMARAVQIFKENAIRSRELESSAEAARTDAEGLRARGEAMRAATAQETESIVSRLGEGLAA